MLRILKSAIAILGVLAGSCGIPDTAGLYDDFIVSDQNDLYADSTHLWSPGEIPVCWENPTATNATERGWVQSAVANSWAKVASVSWVGWGPCGSSSSGIHILIDDSAPHTKGLGTALNGKHDGMVLNFTFANWNTSCQSKLQYCIQTIAIHEFGHTLGFAHEQNRLDTPSSCKEPPQGGNGDWRIGSWDLSSVMNYCNPNWNGDGNLSKNDIQGVRDAYGEKRFKVVSIPDSDLLKGDFTDLIIGDFNGDGKTDFIRQEKGAWDDDSIGTAEVWLSRGNGTFDVVTSSAADRLKGDFTNLITGDFNGDGKTDFIRQEKGAWDDDSIETAEVWLSRGNGTFDVATPNAADRLKGDFTNLIAGDFNGDGKTDFIRQEKGAWDDDSIGTAEVWLSRGNGIFDVVTPKAADSLKGDFTNLITGDFNGDGKTDFIRQEKGAWDDDSIGTAEVWLSRGNGTFDVATPNAADSLKGDFTNLITGDFNGDGKTDFIRQEKGAWDDDSISTADVWLSLGNGTFNVVTPDPADRLKGDFTKLISGDFNGDGKTDFIRQEKGAWDDDSIATADVWRSLGAGAFTIFTPNDQIALKGDYTNLIVGDFNGDGHSDFIRQEKSAWDDDSFRTADIYLSLP